MGLPLLPLPVVFLGGQQWKFSWVACLHSAPHSHATLKAAAFTVSSENQKWHATLCRVLRRQVALPGLLQVAKWQDHCPTFLHETKPRVSASCYNQVHFFKECINWVCDHIKDILQISLKQPDSMYSMPDSMQPDSSWKQKNWHVCRKKKGNFRAWQMLG